ncbi:hypothetical protein E3N88_06942 [Mikania micrantha]|uniref:Uncharacterized protein n=1 Tax=Mikania micrantha TaxID=192012 RepID=A0A5N6PRF7_9ASTR|nr:hypothetical protein E3N88_06942 [Mikania micrantha]
MGNRIYLFDYTGGSFGGYNHSIVPMVVSERMIRGVTLTKANHSLGIIAVFLVLQASDVCVQAMVLIRLLDGCDHQGVVMASHDLVQTVIVCQESGRVESQGVWQNWNWEMVQIEMAKQNNTKILHETSHGQESNREGKSL